MNLELAMQESKRIEGELTRLADDFNAVLQAEDEAQIEAHFEKVSAQIDRIETNERLDGLELGAYLFYAKQMWDLLPLSAKAMKENRYKWREFAKKKSNGRSASTTNNLINAAEVFLISKPQPPDGVEFNPWLVPSSNLIVAAHRAQVGKLTDTAWKMLADPETPYRDLVQQLHKDDPDKDDNDMPMSEVNVLYIEDGVLYFKDTIAGTTVGLVTVDDMDVDDPSVKRGMAVLEAAISTVYASNVQKLLKA